MKKTHATKALGYMLLLSVVITPRAWADNIADCDVLIAETVEDEETGGSALISSYRPAAAFLSSVYDDQDGHVEDIDGHKIRAVLCQRRSAVPTLRDFPILETGTPLSLSQNFDSADSDLTLTRFIDGEFKVTYSGPGLEAEEQAELDDVMDVFNFQPHNLGKKEEAVSEEAVETKEIDETISEVTDSVKQSDSSADLDDGAVELEEKSEEEVSLDAELEEVQLEVFDESVSQDEAALAAAEETQDIDASSLKPTTVPTQSEAVEFDATCQIVTRDAFGIINETPLSAAGLQNNLETSPAFILPLPSGLKMEAIKCERDSLTPGANDYKVARAGYPFFYSVKGDDETGPRSAALEFVRGKYRMNLLEGDFTDQELIDAKARILSFNETLFNRNDELEGPAE